MLKDNNNTRNIPSPILMATLLPLVISNAFGSSHDIDYLSLSLEELIEIEVTTAGKQPQKNRDIPASTVLITRNEIARKGYTKFEEIIANVPGFYAIDSLAYLGTIYGVRGFWTEAARNIKILINGESTVDDFNSQYSQKGGAAPPVDAIERIEIIRGPMSVIYGSGAFFGVINIITNELESEEPEVKTVIRYGSDNLREAYFGFNGNGNIGRKETPFKFALNLSQSYSDGRNEPITNWVSDPTSLEGISPQQHRTTQGKLERDHLYFDLTAKIGNWALNSIYALEDDGVYFNFPSVDTGTNIKRAIISLTYHKPLTDDINITFKGGRTDLDGVFNAGWFTEDYWNRDVFASTANFFEADVFYDITHDLSLTFGYAYRNTEKYFQLWDYPEAMNPLFFDATRQFDSGDDKTVQALYSQIEYDPNQHIKIVLGTRWEQESTYKLIHRYAPHTDNETINTRSHNDDSWEFTPRVALIYFIDSDHTLKLLYGEALNRPGLFQRVDSLTELDNEKIKTTEIVYIGSLSEAFSISASFFHNELENLSTRVTFLIDATSRGSRVENIGSFDTDGVEFGASWLLAETLRVDVNLTHQNSEDQRPGFEQLQPAYSPKTLANFNLLYTLNPQINLSLFGRYVDEMETLWIEDVNTLDSGDRLGKKVDGYTLWNIATSWQSPVYDGDVRVTFSVTNLFDKAFKYPSTPLNAWADAGVAGEGRRFDLSVDYSF